MVIQTPTNDITQHHRNEPRAPSMADRTYQFSPISLILSKVVLFIMAIRLVNLATLVLALTSQVLMAKFPNNLGHMANQLSQWAALYRGNP